MKKRWLSCAAALLLASGCAKAETAWVRLPETVYPGLNSALVFSSDGGSYSLSVRDASGQTAFLSVGREAEPGQTTFWWDGQVNGTPLSPGEAELTVRCGSEAATAPVLIGSGAPTVTVLDAPEEASALWTAQLNCSQPGTLTMKLHGTDTVLQSVAVEGGPVELSWNGKAGGAVLQPGEYDLSFILTNADGISSTAELVSVTVPASMQPQKAHDAWTVYPNADSEVLCDHEVCFWKHAEGDLDEASVWELLTQPVTVLKGGQREQVKVRREPSTDCKYYTGLVTCDSQAVHVLRTEGDWTLIEAYSSCQSQSNIAAYATHIQGWVKTSLLQEKKVSQKYGIVIDKLQQRLYLFVEGKLFSTLLCSTGFPGKDAPWNETQAGEFLVCSWTGGFYSNDMFCDHGLRINSGILLHEVPCYLRTREDGSTYKYYSVFPDYLGEKASHGCIRIQAEKTPEGVNMQWLWDHLEKNTKVIIWDELGRELLPADDDLALYYNASGGRMYHSDPRCLYVSEKYWPLTPFSYGELEDKTYAGLKRCPACAPQLRLSEVDTANAKNNRVVP